MDIHQEISEALEVPDWTEKTHRTIRAHASGAIAVLNSLKLIMLKRAINTSGQRNEYYEMTHQTQTELRDFLNEFLEDTEGKMV